MEQKGESWCKNDGRGPSRGTAGQAQGGEVELAETLGCTISWVGYCATQL